MVEITEFVNHADIMPEIYFFCLSCLSFLLSFPKRQLVMGHMVWVNIDPSVDSCVTPFMVSLMALKILRVEM